MPHALEVKYGLTASELLDAIDRRFRLKVAIEGAVAEVHFERKLRVASQEGWIEEFEDHDIDGMHDFTITALSGRPIRVEVKTVRTAKRTAVEIQKTRNAKDDPSSRFYDAERFDVIAVCMGRKTENWTEFRYALVHELPRHEKYPNKLKVMHDVGDDTAARPRWFSKLQEVIDELGS